MSSLLTDEDEDGDAADPAWLLAAETAPEAAHTPGGTTVAATEAQLIVWMDAVVDHDEAALNQLYRATVSRVLGLVRCIVGRDSLAEEVVEEVYWQVWRQAPRFDATRGRVLTWLLTLARSRAIDALRAEQRHGHEPLGEDSEANPSQTAASPGPDWLLQATEQHQALHRALAHLAPLPRQLVALAFLRGASHEEIAQHTGLALGTVKSHIRRALLSLRQMLESPCPRPSAPDSCPGAGTP